MPLTLEICLHFYHFIHMIFYYTWYDRVFYSLSKCVLHLLLFVFYPNVWCAWFLMFKELEESRSLSFSCFFSSSLAVSLSSSYMNRFPYYNFRFKATFLLFALFKSHFEITTKTCKQSRKKQFFAVKRLSFLILF